MSYEATRAMWAFIRAHDELESADVLVLLALADRMNSKTGLINPSLATLARDCHVAPATVNRAIARLKRVGVLTRTAGGTGVPNRYALMAAIPLPNLTHHESTHSESTHHESPTSLTMSHDLTHHEQPPDSPRVTNQEVTKKEPGADAAATPNGAGAALRMVVSKPADHEASKAAANRVMAELAARWSKSV